MSEKQRKITGDRMVRHSGVLLAALLLITVLPARAYAEEPREEAVPVIEEAAEEAVTDDPYFDAAESESEGADPTDDIAKEDGVTEDSGLNDGEGAGTDTVIDKELIFTSDQTISGNLVVNADISLNGHKLHVIGSLRHLKGAVNFNEGDLVIDGDYIAQSTELDTAGKNKPSYGTLKFENEKDSMVVGGDFLAQSEWKSTMSAGSLELKGNVRDMTGNTICANQSPLGSTHVATFSGAKKQIVELEGSNYFNIIHTRNTDVQFKRLGFMVLDQDVTLTGDVEDIPWPIRLDGHTLTVSGNVTKAANTDVNINKGVFHITGDFRHLYGAVNFNEGALVIDGDYIAQSTELDTAGKNKPSYGTLNFKNEKDSMVAGGDFLAQSEWKSTMSAGSLELKGNVRDMTGNTICANQSSLGSTHVATFSGAKKQIVELEGSNCFNIIHTRNTDVQFKRLGFMVLDQDVNLTGDVEDIPWLIRLDGHTLTVSGNVTKAARTDVNINKGVFHITGDFRHLGGAVNFNEGTLIIDGSYIAQSVEKDQRGDYKDALSTLAFKNADDHMKVLGDFIAQSSLTGSMSAGLLEVGGNVTDITGNTIHAIHSLSSHKTILNGSGHQTVTLKKAMDSGGDIYFFHTLEITKPRSDYTFNPDPCWYGELIQGKKEHVPLTALTLSSDQMTIYIYESRTIGVIKTPADADDEISFESSDPAIAYVDDAGIVTGLRAGKATVTVRGGELEAKCEIKVKAGLEGVRLDKTEAALTVGQKTGLEAKAYPSGVSCNYVWKLSVDKVSENRVSDYITLSNEDGRAMLTGLRPCEAEITVTATDEDGNSKSASARIVVTTSDLINDNTVSQDELPAITEALEKASKEDKLLWIRGLKDKYEFNGAPVEPAVDVYCGSSRLRLARDYSISYSNNKNANQTGKITIKGKGSYSGKTEQGFSIVDEISSGDKSIKKAVVTGLEKSYPYTGSAVNPVIAVSLSGTVLTENKDYMISCSRNTDVGTATLYITGIGEYKDAVKKTFKIKAVNLAEAKNSGALRIKAGSAAYRPGGAVPLVTVTCRTADGREWTLREGTDYKLSFSSNKKPGIKGTVTVKGQGNFAKTASEIFDVTSGDLSELTMSVTDLKYKANQKKAGAYQSKVKIIDKDGKTLNAKKDYVLSYRDISAGVILDAKASAADLKKVKNGDLIRVTAAGVNNGNYSKELVGYYRLGNVKNINSAKPVVAAQAYDGTEKTPKPVMTWGKNKAPLKEKNDFEIVSYRNNVNKGTAYMMLRGLGDYSGTKNISFKINASNVNNVYLGAWTGTEFKR